MSLRILLTGMDGQVGHDLVPFLQLHGELIALGRAELDLSNKPDIRSVLRDLRPNLLVNAAAYTAVDQAEAEPELAESINSVAVAVMAEELGKLGAAMIHYSTDYVFDGRKQSPYLEDDQPNPINAYGKSKLMGERALISSGIPFLILRTSWVYATRGRNFLLTVLNAAATREELRIVNDQFGAPTWSRMIAAATSAIVAKIRPGPVSTRQLPAVKGIYHLTAAGSTSWYDFARAILEECREKKTLAYSTGQHQSMSVKRVIAIPTTEFPRPARRPSNSLLSNLKVQQSFGISMPDWRTQLHVALRGFCSV